MMKRLLALSAALTLLASSGAFAAAQSLIDTDVSQLRPAGTVSATGALNLDDLQDKLAEKAYEQGAKGFVINSAGGENHMHGTATIYK
jgi:MqsR-controlled colanic acid and biofilm protein A